uniref:Endopygalactorunase n=1 Tax=uncultured bacterium CSLG10 TaxID=1091576 RepID=G4WV70_9BACT|nr:endopygalactorunase [uncultured bacterium CSLG10]
MDDVDFLNGTIRTGDPDANLAGPSRRRVVTQMAKLAGVATAASAWSLTTGAAALAEDTARVFDVKTFGATGDGKSLDTSSINKAIDAAASAGGGRVSFPAGSYLCHSIHLQSNITLYLGEGATLVAADPLPQGVSGGYDLAEPNQWNQYQDFGHSHWRNSLIWGEDLHDIAILGPGLIWGKGLSRGAGQTPPVAEQPGVANKAISLKNCRNVTLRDFSILHGGHFGILATGVDNLTIDNLKIDTNRDGIDIDCCRNVRVSNTSVNSPWDDAICLKSSFGLGFARATEMVTITNCFVSGSFEEGTLLDGTYKRFAPDFRVPRTGRVKFGTESNGGFKNITISNIVFDGCQGLALETVDGGVLEDVTITNITMRDIITAPFFLRLGSRMRGPAGVPVGVLRRVVISNVVCSNSASRISSIISGIPGHPIEDVKLSNIYVQHRGGGTQETAVLKPPENETAYPEPTMFGATPSQGCYIRHAKNIELNDFEISALNTDARPAFVLDDVQGASFSHIRIPAHGSEGPAFVLNKVEDFSVDRSHPTPDTQIDRAEQRKL